MSNVQENQQDRFADLRKKLEQPRPESHKFTKRGEILAGTVLRLDVGTTRDGDRVRIVVLDTGGEVPRSVWLLHDALDSQMQRLRPQAGDRLMIRYNGKETSGNGRLYHSYTVVSDSEEPGFTWGESLPAASGSSSAADDEDSWRAEWSPSDDDAPYDDGGEPDDSPPF
jgi:hypothetical protein